MIERHEHISRIVVVHFRPKVAIDDESIEYRCELGTARTHNRGHVAGLERVMLDRLAWFCTVVTEARDGVADENALDLFLAMIPCLGRWWLARRQDIHRRRCGLSWH